MKINYFSLDKNTILYYDLKKMLDASVQFYWPATHSQIYRTLDQMLKDNLVTQEVIQQEQHPNKKVYHITNNGKQELRDWLATPQELPTIRHKLLVQLAWADQLENEEIISLLEAYVQKIEERLQEYHSQEQQAIISDYARTKREGYLWQRILDNGIEMYERELKWVQDTIKGLTNFTP
jgi:PadR family transcriptional regulator AphA